jgi:hypothetical protein
MKVLASKVGRASCVIVATGSFDGVAGRLDLLIAGVAAFCRASGSVAGAELPGD